MIIISSLSNRVILSIALFVGLMLLMLLMELMETYLTIIDGIRLMIEKGVVKWGMYQTMIIVVSLKTALAFYLMNIVIF